MKFVNTIESDWHDIIAVVAGMGSKDHALGLKSDGTVIVAGSFDHPLAGDVQSWKLF